MHVIISSNEIMECESVKFKIKKLFPLQVQIQIILYCFTFLIDPKKVFMRYYACFVRVIQFCYINLLI